MQGRKHTKETKERQSAAAKAWRNGKVLKRAPMTDETKQKISRVLTGRVPTFPKGSKMPEATKSKIREAKKNISAETREKLRLAALIREAKRRESR
jgi:hypothetical protein